MSKSTIMRARHCLCCMLIILLPICAFADPAGKLSVRIVETDPPSGAILKEGDELYIRIAYRSDQPLRFFLHGYFRGEEIDNGAIWSAPYSRLPGEHEDIIFIAYSTGPVAIDQVRLDVLDARRTKITTIPIAVTIEWNNKKSDSNRQPAEWVKQLRDNPPLLAEQNMFDSSLPDPIVRGLEAFLVMVVQLMAIPIPGYFFLQVYMLLKFRGRWRKYATLPLWFTIPVIIYTLSAFAARSNLWPVIMIVTMPLAFAYLLILWVIKRKQEGQRI